MTKEFIFTVFIFLSIIFLYFIYIKPKNNISEIFHEKKCDIYEHLSLHIDCNSTLICSFCLALVFLFIYEIYNKNINFILCGFILLFILFLFFGIVYYHFDTTIHNICASIAFFIMFYLMLYKYITRKVRFVFLGLISVIIQAYLLIFLLNKMLHSSYHFYLQEFLSILNFVLFYIFEK